MLRFTVSERENGKAIERVLRERYPEISRSLFYKLLRKKEIRVNSRRIGENLLLSADDEVAVYVTMARPYRVLWENEEYLVVSKDQGIPVQSDANRERCLLDELRADFGADCALCHRIDRNTGGIIVAAKNKTAQMKMTELFKNGGVKKYYSCVVHGKMPADRAVEKAWHFKDNKKSQVYIYKDRCTGAREIRTGYTVEKYDEKKDVSYLRIELFTGRTHQIRAHLAYLGHPIVGDGKYGVLDSKEGMGLRFQALWASGIETDLFQLSDPPRFR